MLRRLWRWLVGAPTTRDGYYLRVESEAGTVEYGVKTWEEWCRRTPGAFHSGYASTKWAYSAGRAGLNGVPAS